MNENQHNFDELKRLLKLKQHEVPPPGYFNRFSETVVSRIRDGEASRDMTLLERLRSEVSWVAALLRIFETKPGVIGGFATALCLLLVLGVTFADISERSSKKHSETPGTLVQTADPMALNTTLETPPPLLGAESGGLSVSTNPVFGLQPAPAIFGQHGVQTASFSTGR